MDIRRLEQTNEVRERDARYNKHTNIYITLDILKLECWKKKRKRL